MEYIGLIKRHISMGHCVTHGIRDNLQVIYVIKVKALLMAALLKSGGIDGKDGHKFLIYRVIL